MPARLKRSLFAKHTATAVSSRTPAQLARPEEYNRFVSAIELRFLRLAHCEIDARARYDGNQLSPVVTEGNVQYVGHDDGFIVYHELIFDAKPTSGKGSHASVRATFEVEYASPTPVTDELFAVFRANNLPVNVWPFFREFVNTALGRAAWPPYLLPTLKVSPAGRPQRQRVGKTHSASGE